MINFRTGNVFDKAFVAGLGLKAIDGISEVIGGIWLLLVNPARLQTWAGIIFAPELREDPNDFIANHILHWTAHFKQGAVLFAAVYLLSHGVVKLVVVVEILRGKLWAYPGLIVLTSIFAAYQIYHMAVNGGSLEFVVLTIFDLLIIALTFIEYAKTRTRFS